MRSKYNFLLLVFLLSSMMLHAQTLKVSALSEVDNLLLDSKYKEAIAWIDHEVIKIKDPKTKLILENKKAEALIRLGELDRKSVV